MSLDKDNRLSDQPSGQELAFRSRCTPSSISFADHQVDLVVQVVIAARVESVAVMGIEVPDFLDQVAEGHVRARVVMSKRRLRTK